MSRRRATDDTVILTDSTPPLKAGNDAKRHTPTERIGRFFRNRPVSSMLLLITFFSLALVTYSLGRIIIQTVGHVVFGDNHRSGHHHGMSDGWGMSARRHRHKHNGTYFHHHGHGHGHAHEGVGGHGNHHAKNDISDNSDIKQNVHLQHQEHVHPAAEAAARKPTSCHRKFEPGRLGSDKTLCVTDEFYFDITIGDEAAGRFTIGVFGNVVPKSAANFRALATCTGVFSDESLCYRKDGFHRIVTEFVLQGGSKATGRSIYGGTFREEKEKDHHSFLSHSEKGAVAWAEYPIGSQFYVLFRDDAKYLDKNHVVFGVVTEGMDVVEKIHAAPRNGEEPVKPVKIVACGDAHKV